MMNKIIEMCCDTTIMIFVFYTKMSNEQIMNVIQSMYDEFDLLNVYDYDKKTFDEIIMHYRYDCDIDNECEIVKFFVTNNFKMYVLNV